MKAKNLFFVPAIVIFLHTSQSQTWLDTVRTIYSTPAHLHSVTFMKQIAGYGYWSGNGGYLAVSEDSSSSSIIRVGRTDYQGTIIQPFTTILTRPFPIAKMQFVGVGQYIDSLQHQYLFWEEQDTSGWHIMFSHRGQISGWETPSPFSPSSFGQRELVCTQTDKLSYPPPYSFALGWNENDSLTIVKLTPDSVFYRLRIATHTKSDSVHPALSDGMVTWETHDSLSMLRYTTLDAKGPVISFDTITRSQNASCPIFLNYPSWINIQTLCWTSTVNGVGNIIGSNYSRGWSTTFIITQDSTGTNTPIFTCFSPIITKSARSIYYNSNFDYLVFTRTTQDSNAFVRVNRKSRLEFWTKNPILDIDAKTGPYVSSAWIEQTTIGFDLRFHIGLAISDAVEQDPSIPVTFSLEQNFPNPFNPSTVIRYFLPSSGRVKLSIFDILGRELAALVNEKQSVGFHEVSWNAGTFPSGVYFYRLTNDRISITKKMILVR